LLERLLSLLLLIDNPIELGNDDKEGWTVFIKLAGIHLFAIFFIFACHFPS